MSEKADMSTDAQVEQLREASSAWPISSKLVADTFLALIDALRAERDAATQLLVDECKQHDEAFHALLRKYDTEREKRQAAEAIVARVAGFAPVDVEEAFGMVMLAGSWLARNGKRDMGKALLAAVDDIKRHTGKAKHEAQSAEAALAESRDHADCHERNHAAALDLLDAEREKRQAAEAERDKYKQQSLVLMDDADGQHARAQAAEAALAEWQDDHKRVMAEQCAPDEKHCACVPSLRKALQAAQARCGVFDVLAEEARARGGKR